MTRATTPIITFKIPLDTADFEDMILSVKQNRQFDFDMDSNQITLDGRNIILTLTQQQTTEFLPDVPVKVQLRCKVNGAVMASNIVEIPVEDVLNKEVL